MPQRPTVGEDAMTRMAQLADRLAKGLGVTTAYIRERYKVSSATAKRDMSRLESAVAVDRKVRTSAAPSGGPIWWDELREMR